MAHRTREERPVDRTMLMRALFLASAWTLFGVLALADATPPYSLAERVIAVLTVPGPLATLGLLVVFCVQPVWTGKKGD